MPSSTAKAIDSTVLQEFRSQGLSSGPGDFVPQLIDEYLLDASAHMATIHDAIARRDAPSLARATHSLKGSSSAVGAIGMAAMCDRLEQLARAATLDTTPALVSSLESEFARVREDLHLEQTS
ncbi:MAG: Hpt domain-containing protein [Acidobacteriota bacterium]